MEQVMPSLLQGELTSAWSAAHVRGGPPKPLELDALAVELVVELDVEVAVEVAAELAVEPPLALETEVDVEVDPEVEWVVDVLLVAPPEPVVPVWPTPALPPQAESMTIERKRIRMPASYHESRKCRTR
jgi:hypothetical protein